MGMADPLASNQDWDQKLKYLSDEDLMDIWAETQALESTLNAHAPGHEFPGASFEHFIVQELTIRAEQKNTLSKKPSRQ